MHRVINAVIIEDYKLLLFLKRGDSILPGGKPLLDESDLKCLMREFSEENPSSEVLIGDFYGTFIGKAPHRLDVIEARVYFAKFVKKSMETTNEIEKAEFVSDFGKYKISDVTNKIIASLKRDGYLK